MSSWKKIKEEVVYKNFRTMIKATYETPGGNTADYDILADPNFAAVFALTKDKKVIVAKEYRLGPEKDLFDLPGGIMEKDERPEDAARRELLEETGYTGNVIFTVRSYVNAYSKAEKYNFVATDCEKIAEPKTDENEYIDLMLMDLDDFIENVLKKGELSDADTAMYGLNNLGIKF